MEGLTEAWPFWPNNNPTTPIADRVQLELAYEEDSGPTKFDRPVWDSRRRLFVAGATFTHVVDLMPQLWGEYHVGLTPKREFERGRFGVPGTNPPGLDAVWLYRSLDEAMDAVRRWAWLTEPEPPDYRKRC